MEFASTRISGSRLVARGGAVRATPAPYSLTYTLRTAEDFVTQWFVAFAEGSGLRRRLTLGRDADGSWSCELKREGEAWDRTPYETREDLAGALDCDLGLSPLTNTMPVLRHGLLDGGGPVDFLMAWISVPDLVVVPSRQRYEFLRRDGDHSVVHYSSDGSAYEITFDSDGLVVDYPGLARRVGG
jgi:hypothetical protein